MQKIYGVIYGLSDPRDNKLKYIGQTIQPLNIRLNSHLYDARKNRLMIYSSNWIKSLLKENVKPEITMIDTALSKEELNDLEIYYIDYFKRMGCKLTNLSLGGKRDFPIKDIPKEYLEKRLSEGASFTKIAKELKCSSSVIKNRAVTFGLVENLNFQQIWLDKCKTNDINDKNIIIEKFNEGWTFEKISKLLNCSEKRVSRIIHELKLIRNNPKEKLSKEYLIEKIKQNFSGQDFYNDLQCSQVSFYTWVRELGINIVELRKQIKEGELN